MTQRRPSTRALVLCVLLVMNLLMIVAGFLFTPLNSGFDTDGYSGVNPVTWPRAVLVYVSVIAFGGMTTLIGALLTVQHARGKHNQSVFLGLSLALAGLMMAGFTCYSMCTGMAA